MNHEFTVGRRFSLIRAVSLAANTAVVVTFYFIYRFLFQSYLSESGALVLLLVFLAVGFAVAKITLWVAGRYAATVYYKVAREGLTVGRGPKARFYPWESFTGVRLRNDGAFHFGTVLPVSFQTGGEEWMLNQYVGDIYQLAYEIVGHVEGRVSVPAELKKQLEAMRHTFS